MKKTTTKFLNTLAAETVKPPCKGKIADVAFVVDHSKSIDRQEFELMKKAVREYAYSFEFGPTRAAVVMFAKWGAMT